MRLVVGLGNIGSEYDNTRHNMGFILLDSIATKYSVNINKDKFGGKYGNFIYNEEKVILLKPQKYINLSGEVLIEYVNYFKVDISDILIINDDLDMDFGKIKLKTQGSSGGHNGLKNIELHLKTKKYNRLKVGISNNKKIDTKDYVLGKFNNEEKKILCDLKFEVLNIFEDYMNMNFDILMNKYNKK